MKDLDAEARRSRSTSTFGRSCFPVLTPMAIDPSHPSPRFHNRGLYLAAMLERVSGIGPSRLFAVVQVPQVLPRFVPVEPDDKQNFVMLEDLDRAAGCRICSAATGSLDHAHVPAHARHGHQPAGAGGRRHAAVDRVAAAGAAADRGGAAGDFGRHESGRAEDARHRRGAALRHESATRRRRTTKSTRSMARSI